MKRKSSQKQCFKSSQEQIESMCGQPGPDDGIDPRDFFKSSRQRRNSRKDWQLCRQVSDTLNYVLSGDCRDEIVQGLIVTEVAPAPDAHRLLVTVCPFAPGDDFSPVVALERLQRLIGRLRSEVARSISRRKVPELIFRVTLNPLSQVAGKEHQYDQ